MSRRKGPTLRQFELARTAVTPMPAVTQPFITPAVPQVPIVVETEESLMQQLAVHWQGTPEQVAALVNLRYTDGTPIISLQQREIILTIVGLLRDLPFAQVVEFLSGLSGPPDILWQSPTPALQEAYGKYTQELLITRETERGITGVGVCIYCKGSELVFTEAATRSGDESMTIFVRCVLCGRQQHRR